MNKKISIPWDYIKLFAAFTMLVDHAGIVLFPQYGFMRIIGRLSFPIFSFSIYLGCKYTRDKRKYFNRIFLLGIAYFIGYYLFSKEIYGNIFMTFSLSILITIYGVQRLKEALMADEHSIKEILIKTFNLIALIIVSYFICKILYIDYGFYGVLLPVFAEIFDFKFMGNTFYGKILPILGFSVGLLLLSINIGGIQIYSILALPLIFLANGQNKKLRLKYFFYWFYPLHLVGLEIIAYFLK